MDITESNKLIAEFMGMENNLYHFQSHDTDMHYTDSELKFHTSWDWLMPVVDSIETFNFKVDGVTTSADVHIVYGDCRIVDEDGGGLFEFYSHSTDSGDKLQATYDSVVKFIEWYNLVRKINQR